jgi:hypothetical protein
MRLWQLQLTLVLAICALVLAAKQARPQLPANMKQMCEHPAGPLEAEACSSFSR